MASDSEDYAVVPSADSPGLLESHRKSPSSLRASTVTHCSEHGTNEALEKLTKQLKESDNTITDLKAEVTKLRAYAETLKNENLELKTRLSQVKHDSNSMDCNPDTPCVNGYSGPGSLDGLLLVNFSVVYSVFL